MAALRVCATPINRAGQYTTLPDATPAVTRPVPRYVILPVRRMSVRSGLQAGEIADMHGQRPYNKLQGCSPPRAGQLLIEAAPGTSLIAS